MAKILAAVDGSPHSRRAVEHLVRLCASLGPQEIHLLNVAIPVESGHARLFVGPEELQDWYRAEGLAALAEARALLDAAGLPYSQHIAVGHVAPTIAAYASEQEVDQILLGSHGRGALSHLLLGSVASDVLRLSPVPVTLVK